MQVSIISPTNIVFSGDAMLVQVPGTKGSFAMMEAHAPIISTLERGKVKIITPKGTEKFFKIKGGIMECSQNVVSILIN